MKGTVSEKGQITIPKPLRDRFGIDRGTVLKFEESDGSIVMRKVLPESPVDRVLGVLADSWVADEFATTDEFIEAIRGTPDAID